MAVKSQTNTTADDVKTDAPAEETTKPAVTETAVVSAEVTVDDVLVLLRDGKPLPAGWAFNARRKPPVFRIDEHGNELGAEAGNAPA